MAAEAQRAAPKARIEGGEAVLVALAALYVVGLGLWPLLRLLSEAFAPGPDGTALASFHEAAESRAVARALRNTLISSTGSVAVSVVLGAGLALVMGLLGLRARAAMTFLILSPLLIPSQILALAWIELLGPTSPLLRPLGLAAGPGEGNPLYSGGGIVLLLGIEHMPIVFLSVRAALLAVPQSIIEAAQSLGAGRARAVLSLVLPLVAPALLSGAVLAFAAAVGNFGVPALLGIPGRYPVLTTLIYQRLSSFGPSMLGQVAVLSLLLVALAGVALGLRLLLGRRAVPVDRTGPPLAPVPLGHWRPWVEAALWALIGVLSVVPLLALAATALSPALGVRLSLETATLQNFAAALESPAVRRAFANSAMLSAAAAAVAALAALAIAFMAVQGQSRVARALDVLADAPFVVPGTVLGVAYVLVFLRPLPLLGVSLYGTAAILLLAYLARFLPLVLRPTAALFQSAEPAIDEAARLLGAGPATRLARIAAPMAAPAVVAGAVLVFMTAFNELAVSALLWSSGVETVGVTIFSMQYEGNSTGAAALSVLSITLVLALGLGLDRLAPRLPPGTLPWRS